MSADAALDAAPEALNIGLVALLKTGTKDLRLNIPLTSPDTVASVLPGSGLESIHLGHTANLHFSAEALNSHRAVMSSLASCPTLKHLSLGNADLLRLHAVLARFKEPGGPALTSVSLQGYSVQQRREHGFIDHTFGFITQIAGFSSLKVFEAEVPLADALYLARVVLKPLENHPSLTELHVTGGTTFLKVWDMFLLPFVFAFACQCPSLTTFRYTADAVAEGLDLLQAWSDWQQRGHDLNPVGARELMEEVLVSVKNLALRTLQVNGVFVPKDVLNTISAAMGPGGALDAIKNLHLAKCILDLKASIALMDMLLTRMDFNAITLPEPDGYCLTSSDGGLHGLTRSAHPVPALRDNVSPAIQQEILSVFAQVEGQANALLGHPQRLLDDKFRPALFTEAKKGLMINVANLLASAYALQNGIAPEDANSQTFMPHAADILDYLGTSYSLLTAAQLAGVSQQLQAKKGHPPGDAMRRLVAMDRRNGGDIHAATTTSTDNNITTTHTTTRTTDTTATVGTTTTTTNTLESAPPSDAQSGSAPPPG